MTTAQFFEKFDLFAGAPDAVAKMRSLILELAVRGQLTSAPSHPSDPSDPSGNPFPIPGDWRWVTLNDLGNTKPRNDAPDYKACAFVPMAMIPAEYGAEATHEARKWGEIKKGYTHFAESDVVMAKITPCFENGKSAVMRNLTGNMGAGTTELHVFRGDGSKVLPAYVLIFLKSRGFIERGIPKMTGSAGQKRVPHDYFANSPFPLPPIAEQKRIVAKVDELMALCDQLEAQQQERETKHTALAQATLARFAEAPTPGNLNLLFHSSFSIQPSDLRKTILTLAVQGKLVPQDPTDEPAEVLLARISKLRSSAKTYNAVSDDEKAHDLPKSWVWARLGDVAVSSDSGWSPQCLPHPAPPNSWGVLKVSAVSWGQFLANENKTLPPGIQPRPNCQVRPGDFLLSRANTAELVARSVVVGDTRDQLMMSD